jgi:hypothetical protein
VSRRLFGCVRPSIRLRQAQRCWISSKRCRSSLWGNVKPSSCTMLSACRSMRSQISSVCRPAPSRHVCHGEERPLPDALASILKEVEPSVDEIATGLHRLVREAAERSRAPDPDVILRRGRRGRRRRGIGVGLAVLTLSALVVVGGAQLRPRPSTTAPPAAAPSTAVTPSTLEGPGEQPWSRSAAAAWLRKALAKAGSRPPGSTGSALVGRINRVGFHAWTTDGSLIPKALAAEGYSVRARVNGVAVYSDGVRVAWAVQGLTVWAEPTASADLLGHMTVVQRLVDATKVVPY